MPLYEYQCDACTTRFERIQKFADPPIDTCPSCGGSVRKLLSSPAIQFKGSGWYITDYAKKGAGRSKEDAKPAAESAGGASTKETTSSAPAAADSGKSSSGSSGSSGSSS
jgi:putative FmdB family regulatory protein